MDAHLRTYFLPTILAVLSIMLAACGQSPTGSTEEIRLTPPTKIAVSSHTPTATIPPTATPGQTQTRPDPPTPTSQPTADQPVLCSPLEGIALEQVPDSVANPFNPPRSGSDDPHQGIDLAQLSGDPQIALAGLPVQAVMTGKVAMVISERFPYGNALVIETPVEGLPTEWKLQLQESVSPTPTTNRSALTCPAESDPIPDPQAGERSLYWIYAHMLEPPAFDLNEQVECGQIIGAIGSSGNALNPHLHLEVRTGPAGMRFASMAHYDTRATPKEMGNYCLWRVSGQFQLLDPMNLLHLPP